MIIRTRNQGTVELRSAFALTDMVRWGYQGLRNITTQVGEKEMRGIPAINRGARLRAEAVASLCLYCWRGEGVERRRVDTTWQARLFAKKPNGQQTRFEFWETVEESLSYRGNGYAWLGYDRTSKQVAEWYALHPDQVKVNADGSFEVVVAPGYVDPVGKGPATYKDLGPDTVLHFRGHGQGGQLLAPSPVQVFREKMAGPIGRQRHEARMWRRGTALQVGIEFPAGVSKESADQWREQWRSNYEGTEGETTAVIGGGATIKPIGMTATDAQFVDLARLTIEDAALIMALPANLLGVQLQRAVPNLEQDKRMWLEDGLGPELSRIEDTLSGCEVLFGNAQTYPGFFTDGFVRGDLATESAILVSEVQAGITTQNEARAIRGLPPSSDPRADELQFTPVGGAQNTVSSPGDSGTTDQGDN